MYISKTKIEVEHNTIEAGLESGLLTREVSRKLGREFDLWVTLDNTTRLAKSLSDYFPRRQVYLQRILIISDQLVIMVME